VLTVGRPPSGGRDPGDTALLARDAETKRLYLVWHDHRYEITDEKIVLEGLTMTAEPVVAAGGAWLNALPAGESIGTRGVNGRGGDSTAVPGGVTGRVYVVQGESGSRQYYLARATSLVPITEVQAAVLLADPATRGAYGDGSPRAVPLDAGTAATAEKSDAPDQGAYRAPTQRPDIARLTGDRPAVCAAYQPGKDEPQVVLDAQVQPVKEPVGTTGRTGDGVPLADRVVLEPGYGVLVSAMSSPEAPTGTLNLVTDLGYRYPLSSAEVPAMLGYGQVTPVRLPASLVVRLPSGPALDPAAAKRALDAE
jgi:type VII secretion protein EccB